MSSYFEYHGRLSNQTMQAWNRMNDHHCTFGDRLRFYMLYFQDTVPYDVSVHHIPAHIQAHDLNEGSSTIRREEIQLRCMEGILMTGLVSMESQNYDLTEIGAVLAYEHLRDGMLVRDPRLAWGMFTCLRELRFFYSIDSRLIREAHTYRPIADVRDVVRYIRREYERIRGR